VTRLTYLLWLLLALPGMAQAGQTFELADYMAVDRLARSLKREVPKTFARPLREYVAPGSARRGQIEQYAHEFADGKFTYAEATLGKTMLGYSRYQTFSNRYQRGKTMLFDIVVKPKFRRKGLYTALFAHALRQSGGVENIPILLYEGTNNKLFLDSIGGKRQLTRWSRQRLEQAGEGERLALRQRMIDAVTKMPAYKVREKHGYAKIRSIRFNPHRGSLIVDIAKGRPQPASAVKVFMADQQRPCWSEIFRYDRQGWPAPRLYEISARGTLGKVRGTKRWWVGGYDQSKAYRREHVMNLP